ncbi:hypothetical protein DMZ43_05870 [Meridianimaribacter sp. CL38]|uniref:T9SS type A sorting domain-containing protein n=1 Tax=Meridianimaribacter sp. CL38 TaxID=2213021 RepID=UPI00103BC1A1|nr:T9SS type A sorting domain-containing protein [Meridianimaribacter sp. CL38]TBV26590.1 hypothetical protein DMZ43_05870 [Meridianimaribacter sp. CL38]
MKNLFPLLLFISLMSYSQTQIGENIEGVEPSEGFGWSVSLSTDGTIVAIGAHNYDGNGFNLGITRVFRNVNGTWTQIGSDMEGENDGDRSGHSVYLSGNGNVVAIGAKLNDDNGNSSGHVRVYENQSDNWVQIGQDIAGETEWDQSGHSVSLSDDGSIVAVGAILNEDNGFASGHVRVYENQSGNWVQIGQDIDGDDSEDEFGWSVSLSSDGSILAAGARSNDGNGLNSGQVRIYEFQSGNWVQIGQDIYGDGYSKGTGYSLSLSADGSIIAIGGNGSSVTESQVRVFENQSGNWVQIGQNIDNGSNDNTYTWSGYSVSISTDGTILTIGAPLNSNENFQSGQVRVYQLEQGNWVLVGQEIYGESAGDLSGNAVSSSANGSIIAIGSSASNNGGTGNDTGHVRLFDMSSGLALRAVIDDILGNLNGIEVSAEQLNSIEGVSGAIEGISYSTALANGTYVDPTNPTAQEIQAVIDLVNAGLSINDDEWLELLIYPNPANKQIKLDLPDRSQLKKISIYNNKGQFLFFSRETTIDVSNLSTGMYILKIESLKGTITRKFLID